MKEKVDKNVQRIACQYIGTQLGRLMDHLQGARAAEDAEDIHQTRVACRRLRSALDVFSDCFDPQRLGLWKKRLRKLLKSFGQARDLDVQIKFLEKRLADIEDAHKTCRAGIKRMLLRWRQRRDSIQSKIVRRIDKIHKDHVMTNIHLEVERILFELRSETVPESNTAVIKRFGQQIQNRVHDLLSREGCLERPDDIEEHHAMRIAAKKLRYTLEICDAAIQDRLKATLKKVKKIQTLLGDLHDCDIWDSDIQQFIGTEHKRTIDFFGDSKPFKRILPGLELLQSECRNRRKEVFHETYEYFARLRRENFWESLPDRLQSGPENIEENTADEAVEPEQDSPDTSDRDSV